MVIPAYLGWAVVTALYDDEGCVVGSQEDPVVAWVVDEPETRAYPVTIHGADDRPVLKRPDGIYAMAGAPDFGGVMEVLQYLSGKKAIGKRREHDGNEAA